MVKTYAETHYHDLSHMVVHHGKSAAIYSNLHLSHIRYIRAATVFIALGYREGLQTVQIPTGLRQYVFTCALEVIIVAIKGVVVRITPCPACAVVLGHTHGIAMFKAACLFLWTMVVSTWICR